MREAKVAVSPGIGFGEYGDTHVRLALVENVQRIRQAVRAIKQFMSSPDRLPDPPTQKQKASA
jgi:alanine-synthesizing transaminase